MEQIDSLLNNTSSLLIVSILVGAILLVALFAIAMPRKKQPTRTISSGDLTDDLSQIEQEINNLKDEFAVFKNHMSDQARRQYQTEVFRYNPFKDSGVGGNQSFSLAHINADGNGFVITHLFSREMSRVSTKQISAWTSEQEMSPEEQEVLNKLK